MKENPFMAEVLKLMRAERMPIRNVDEAIEAARGRYPELYENYIATFFDDSLSAEDRDDADFDIEAPRLFTASALGNGLQLSMPLQMTAGADGGPNRFRMVAYTGGVLKLRNDDLVIAVKGVEAPGRIPVLREHHRERVVGFGKPWADDRTLFVDGEFTASTVDGVEVQALLAEGFPWQASVGIWPTEKTSLVVGKSTTVNGRAVSGPATIWSRSRVGEVSFVSLGMDSNTSVGRA